MINVNINVEDVLLQKERETVKKTVVTFNEKNYLQARLAPNESTKKIRIRLLPFSAEEAIPFHKIHMHQVRVNKEVSASGWKKFPCPVKNKMGQACPFCETAEGAKKMKFAATTEQEKKNYYEVEKDNSARDMWVVRCIERGHEEDGVKFWLFNSSKKNDGVYDKIYNIFEDRFNSAKERGKYHNIFDLNEGSDLILTLTRDSMGKTVINITDDYEKTPLSENDEQALNWINDTKQWSDVYATKSYDYMSVIVQGGIPYFDKNQNKYVDKNEFLNHKQEMQNENTVEVKDLSTYNEEVSKIQTATITSSPIFVEDVDDDLPF